MERRFMSLMWEKKRKNKNTSLSGKLFLHNCIAAIDNLSSFHWATHTVRHFRGQMKDLDWDFFLWLSLIAEERKTLLLKSWWGLCVEELSCFFKALDAALKQPETEPSGLCHYPWLNPCFGYQPAAVQKQILSHATVSSTLIEGVWCALAVNISLEQFDLCSNNMRRKPPAGMDKTRRKNTCSNIRWWFILSGQRSTFWRYL